MLMIHHPERILLKYPGDFASLSKSSKRREQVLIIITEFLKVEPSRKVFPGLTLTR